MGVSRNDDINARDFFTNRSGGPKPDLIRNQFGATLGGPIFKDHTFFFVNYEAFREKRGTTRFSTIPTLQQRQGILGVPVMNPLTGQVFEDGVIPQDQISPFAKQVFAGLPDPTAPGARNNFRTARLDVNNTDKFDVKIDHTFNDRFSVFGRISHRKMNLSRTPDIPGPSGGGGNGFVRVLNQQLAVGATWTLSSTSLLEGRLGISRTNAGKEPVNIGSLPAGELFGIPGLPTNRKITGGLPNQRISGFSQLGQQATNPQYQNPKSWDPKVNYAWIAGAHSLKVGYEFQRIRVGVQDVNPLNGQFRFSGAFSRPEGVSGPNSAFNLADFIFGAPSQFSLVNFFEAEIQERMHFAYLQDDWKLSPNFTLNLGVRYEYGSPLYDGNNNLTNFDPVTNSIIFASDGSIANRALVNNDLNNWAPRVGFAWSFAPKTVLRGGYGVSYIHPIQQRVGGANLLAINAPQVVIGRQVQTPDDSNFRTLRGDGNPRDGVPEGFNDPITFNPLETTIRFIPKDTRTSYVQSWHLSLQREILRDTLLDVAYIGNLGLKLNVLGDFNQARPNNLGETTPLQERRPISDFSAISTAFNRASSNYHALQIKLERQAASGLYLLNSFTWSKAIDNAAGSLEDPNGNSGNPQSILNLDNDRGLSGFDQRINNVTSLVWDVPFGRGRRFGSGMSSVMDNILGGWQVSVINFARSGNVVNLRYTPSSAFKVTADLASHEGGVSFRPNIIGDPKTPGDQRTVDNYLNRETIVAPTDPSQPFGNAGRNIVRGEGFFQTDLAINKDISLPGALNEETRLQFRAEFFNLFNTTNFKAPNGNLSSGSFGTIRRTFPAREIQFGVKLFF
ncbi:TonB-dependent receptor [Acidobacteria bacterium AH-259-D05]|nr:TonB-dependent receptor [Acidobacteria bacterium AH-259-D05]